jgi:hypothetical protein
MNLRYIGFMIFLLCSTNIYSQYDIPVAEQLNMHVLYFNYPTTLRIEAKNLHEQLLVKCIKIRKSDFNGKTRVKGKYLDKEVKVETTPFHSDTSTESNAFRLTVNKDYFNRRDVLRVEFHVGDSLYAWRDYELRTLPVPQLYWNGLKSGLFQKERQASALHLAYGETSILRNMNFQIVSWQVQLEGNTTFVTGKGNLLSMEASQYIKSAPAKSWVIIKGEFTGFGFVNATFDGRYQL